MSTSAKIGCSNELIELNVVYRLPLNTSNFEMGFTQKSRLLKRKWFKQFKYSCNLQYSLISISKVVCYRRKIEYSQMCTINTRKNM